MKKSRSKLASSLAARVPYDVSKPIFELNSVPRGRGWQGTADKLNDKKETPDGKLDGLLEALNEHQLAGEKLVTLYEASDSVMKAMRATLKSATVSTGPLQDAYPFLLNETELEKLPLGQPVLLAIEEFGGGIGAVFGSVRARRERVVLDPSSFADGTANALSIYDEVVGLKLIRHQAFDVIWIPGSGDYFDLRVDCPRNTQADIARGSQMIAMDVFRKLVGTDPFKKPLNLFPAMKAMYDDASEGRVVELAFGTTTRSIKQERMRLSGDCLRDELYHKGGKEKLKTPVKPYKLSLAYTIDLGGGVEANPEVNLHTTRRVAENPNPQLFDALIRKSVGLFDYDYVRERIIHFA